jgi:hypothetical protein
MNSRSKFIGTGSTIVEFWTTAIIPIVWNS